jgi:hypothetical protein
VAKFFFPEWKSMGSWIETEKMALSVNEIVSWFEKKLTRLLKKFKKS